MNKERLLLLLSDNKSFSPRRTFPHRLLRALPSPRRLPVVSLLVSTTRVPCWSGHRSRSVTGYSRPDLTSTPRSSCRRASTVNNCCNWTAPNWRWHTFYGDTRSYVILYQHWASFFSPLETIPTSLWASLHHHFPVLPVFNHVSSYLFVSSRLLSIHLRLGRPLLLFSGTTMSIIFLERLSSLIGRHFTTQYSMLLQDDHVVVRLHCVVVRGHSILFTMTLNVILRWHSMVFMMTLNVIRWHLTLPQSDDRCHMMTLLVVATMW